MWRPGERDATRGQRDGNPRLPTCFGGSECRVINSFHAPPGGIGAKKPRDPSRDLWSTPSKRTRLGIGCGCVSVTVFRHATTKPAPSSEEKNGVTVVFEVWAWTPSQLTATRIPARFRAAIVNLPPPRQGYCPVQLTSILTPDSAECLRALPLPQSSSGARDRERDARPYSCLDAKDESRHPKSVATTAFIGTCKDQGACPPSHSNVIAAPQRHR